MRLAVDSTADATLTAKLLFSLLIAKLIRLKIIAPGDRNRKNVLNLRMQRLKLKSRVLRLVMLAALLAASAGTQAQQAVSKFTSSPAIKASSSSVLITDLNTGKVIASHNADKPLLPASIMKSVTIASLLGETGTDWKYETPVYLEGEMKGNELIGNLVVVGSGDPSINSKVEPYSADLVAEIVGALKRKGVKRISGKIVVDCSIYPETYPPTWANGDKAYSYGAGQFGLNFENNCNGKSAEKNPPAKFETRLRGALSNAGISVGGGTSSGGKRHLLVTHYSPMIEEIMRSCMMRSDNLFAECFARTLAHLKGEKASSPAGGNIEFDMWKKRGARTAGVVIADGSGLSRTNRLTANFVTDVLTRMKGNPYYASFFPLAGQEGTLRKFLKDTKLDGYLAMKTGSMTGVQCYAGYLLDDDYVPTHTVVIMLNDFPRSRDAAREAAAAMLLELLKN